MQTNLNKNATAKKKKNGEKKKNCCDVNCLHGAVRMLVSNCRIALERKRPNRSAPLAQTSVPCHTTQQRACAQPRQRVLHSGGCKIKFSTGASTDPTEQESETP
ncbi:unnamed protein product [Ixodes pacificus]